MVMVSVDFWALCKPLRLRRSKVAQAYEESWFGSEEAGGDCWRAWRRGSDGEIGLRVMFGMFAQPALLLVAGISSVGRRYCKIRA
jgi:hypothetical protein